MSNLPEPEGIDFVISGGHWSPEVVAEVAEFLRLHRQQRLQGHSKSDKSPNDLVNRSAVEQTEEQQKSHKLTA